MAAAPRAIASGTYRAPSALAPAMAAKSQPARTSRLSAVMPAISVSPLLAAAVNSGPSRHLSFMAPWHLGEVLVGGRGSPPARQGFLLCPAWGVKPTVGRRTPGSACSYRIGCHTRLRRPLPAPLAVPLGSSPGQFPWAVPLGSSPCSHLDLS